MDERVGVIVGERSFDGAIYAIECDLQVMRRDNFLQYTRLKGSSCI